MTARINEAIADLTDLAALGDSAADDALTGALANCTFPERLSDAELADLKAARKLITQAEERMKEAASATLEARGAYRFVWGKLRERYGITDADGIMLEDGTIQRVPTA